MAAGVPVVVSDFAAMRHVVLDNPDGPLGAVANPLDPAAIAAALRSTLELPPAEAAELRERCRRAAWDRWNWEVESARMLDLYADIAAGRAAVGSREG